MEEKEILASAVINNITVPSKFGNTQYNVVQLFHEIQLETLKESHSALKSKLEKLEGDTIDLPSASDVKKINVVKNQIALIKLIYKLRQQAEAEKTARDKAAKTAKEDKEFKRNLLLQGKNQKESERILKLTPEQIEAELALLD